MAKELPYFKFYINDWLTGNVTLLDMQSQGVFINVCVLFWSRDCELKIDDLFERFKKKDRKYLEKLIEKKIISIENKNISIKFLEKQQEKFKILSETGKKNVKKRYKTEENQASNSTNEKELVYNIDEIREEERRGDKRREDNTSGRVFYPFDSINFKTIWQGWKLFLTEAKKPYHTFSSEQAALQSLSKYSESEAIEVIKQSIKNQWTNLYELSNGKQKSINQNERKASLDGLSELTNRVLQQPFTINDNYSSNSE